MENDKTPGNGELSKEFYEVFWNMSKFHYWHQLRRNQFNLLAYGHNRIKNTVGRQHIFSFSILWVDILEKTKIFLSKQRRKEVIVSL